MDDAGLWIPLCPCIVLQTGHFLCSTVSALVIHFFWERKVQSLLHGDVKTGPPIASHTKNNPIFRPVYGRLIFLAFDSSERYENLLEAIPLTAIA